MARGGSTKKGIAALSKNVARDEGRVKVTDVVALARRPSALDRRDHGGRPVKLDRAGELLLMEAVRRGEMAQRKNQDTMLEYGQWLLDTVFEGNTTNALDPTTKNPVWTELVRRAGGPTLHLDGRFLYVSLRIAAYDKRITDESWRLLDIGRKELLLPLAEPAALREGARHVTKFDLTHKMVHAYVTAQLAAHGEARKIKWTPAQMGTQVSNLCTMIAERAPVHRLRELRSKLPEEERKKLLDQVKELQKMLGVVTRELGK